MTATLMGRRYERLLFFAGPLALACVLVMFVALAFDQQEERREARCLAALVSLIEAEAAELDKAYAKKTAIIGGRATDSYWLALSYVSIFGQLECRKSVGAFIPDTPSEKIPKPSALSEQIRKRIRELEQRPLTMYGIELPEKATISALGTPIRMDLIVFVKVAQIALGPILLLWLGSLYNTRHRESLYIRTMSEVRNVYPHMVNVYPVAVHTHGARTEPRRRGFQGWAHYLFDKFGIPAIAAVTRIGLLSVFIGPPVGFYVASVVLVNLAETGSSYLSIALGGLVGIFATVNLLAELAPWLLTKRFRIIAPFTI